jgi:hypothetical protein
MGGYSVSETATCFRISKTDADGLLLGQTVLDSTVICKERW